MILASDLAPRDQDELFVVFARVGDKELASVRTLFEEEPGAIRMLSANYKAKRNAVAARDTKAWQNALLEEEQFLQTKE